MRFWLDCEFDGYRGALLTLALVSEDGDELYWADPAHDLVTDDWVRSNVVPVVYCRGALPNAPPSLAEAIERFLANTAAHTNAHIIADWPDDIAYFCRALLTAPGKRIDTPPLTFEVARLDAYPTTLPGAVRHNALWDARALRHLMMATPTPAASPALRTGTNEGDPNEQ